MEQEEDWTGSLGRWAGRYLYLSSQDWGPRLQPVHGDDRHHRVAWQSPFCPLKKGHKWNKESIEKLHLLGFFRFRFFFFLFLFFLFHLLFLKWVDGKRKASYTSPLNEFREPCDRVPNCDLEMTFCPCWDNVPGGLSPAAHISPRVYWPSTHSRCGLPVRLPPTSSVPSELPFFTSFLNSNLTHPSSPIKCQFLTLIYLLLQTILMLSFSRHVQPLLSIVCAM